jgi:hypothetical protein
VSGAPPPAAIDRVLAVDSAGMHTNHTIASQSRTSPSSSRDFGSVLIKEDQRRCTSGRVARSIVGDHDLETTIDDRRARASNCTARNRSPFNAGMTTLSPGRESGSKVGTTIRGVESMS